jgi:dTDP-4-dehydrorhamnose 3,5-epimerase
MEFIPQSIPEVILIKPALHGDHRGYFVETFRQDQFEKAVGHSVAFLQDNESRSSRGVLRGLHFQLPPYAQSKLVRVVEGMVLDVAVDIRVGSPTYGTHVSSKLSADNKHQLWIPRGFAHGFVVLSEYAIFSYKVDRYYAPEYDSGIKFDDANLNIAWELPSSELQLSEKDLELTRLDELPVCFLYDQNLYDR